MADLSYRGLEPKGTLSMDEDGDIHLPAHLRDYVGRLSVRAPGITIAPYPKTEGANTLKHMDRHFGMRDYNPDLAPDRVALKPYGGDWEVWTVRLPTSVRADGGLNAGEPTWCETCDGFFTESVQEHGRRYHEDERWDVDYQKEPENDD